MTSDGNNCLLSFEYMSLFICCSCLQTLTGHALGITQLRHVVLLSQVNQKGSQQYSIAQRWASIIINGILLFVVGFVSSLFGVGVINVLVAVRSFFDSHVEGIEMSQEVLGISVAHGVYMASSGNIRYQVLAGIVEERGVNILFAHNARLLRIVSSIIRTINTYYGSEHWIVFIRYFGLQDA